MMNRLFNPETSALILRLTLGTVLLAHSLYLKMVVFTLAGTAQFFVSIGLPATLAYIVFLLEAIVGVGLLLGFYTRIFSALIIPVLLGATWVHSASGWLFTNTGGGWEYPLVLSLMAIVQLGLGDGKYALSHYLLARQSLRNS
ncbi:DoxX family protein [Motilimonas sp. KMU-193]|uniref:DoxX family protein n=1 Tax=Motilimonas sp. KMU-193 TaxID=3388668 RepID=UPI00396B3B35